MTRKVRFARYGHAALIIAAFVLVASITAAPVIQRAWTPAVTATNGVRLPITPVALKAERRG
jgi:hypothetical protein